MSEWQVSPSNRAVSSKKRAYVGNLKYTHDIQRKLQTLFQQSAISVNGIEIVKLSNAPKGVEKKCIALVQCDVEAAIKCLDGVQFEGKVINVQREKKKMKKNIAKFGSGWSTPSTHSAKDAKCKAFDQNIDGNSHSVEKSQPCQNLPHTILNMSDGKSVVSAEQPSTEAVDSISSFYARINTPLSNLVEEYGERDHNFEQMVVGKEDQTDDDPKALNHIDGILAPQGKAPIHLEIISFGFKYGAPSEAREGWSHANPLAPIDCRLLPRCPHHVAKLSGLSFKVKCSLLRSGVSDDATKTENLKEGSEIINPLIDMSNEIAETVLKETADAINEGGHGYAFPLGTSIYIGSEYGRHRSVVLVEKVAQNIRSIVRDNHLGLTQPISVSTRHRDIDRNHRDEEAFGIDMRRSQDAERKRKSERSEDSW